MFAENGTGTTEGADRTFTTGAAADRDDRPGDRESAAVEATLKGTVNPKGLETKYFFNYGTTRSLRPENRRKIVAGSGHVERHRLESSDRARTRNRPTTSRSSPKTPQRGRSQRSRPDLHDHRRPGRDHRAGERNRRNDGDRERRRSTPRARRPNTSSTTAPPTSYGQKTSETSVGAGTTDVNAAAQLTGLAPGTAYHFQLVAKSAGGDNLRPGRDLHDRIHSSASPTTAAPGADSDPPADTGTVPDPARHQDHDQAGGEDARSDADDQVQLLGRRLQLPVQRRQQAVQGMPLALHRSLAEARQAQDPGQSDGERPDRAGAGVLQLQGGRCEVGV